MYGTPVAPSNGIGLLRAGRAVFADPGEDLVVPVATVRGLRHPVAFIRKVDVLAGNTLTLQRCEQLIAFAHGNSEVQIVVNDQHRSLKVRRQTMRRMLFVGLAIGTPRRSAVFVFVEPQFFGRRVHTVEVVNAAMSHQRFELRRITLEPVHHVTTKRRAGGEHAVGVDVRLLFEKLQTSHQVDITSAAPVTADLIGVLLAEARAASWIRRGDDVALSRPDLGFQRKLQLSAQAP